MFQLTAQITKSELSQNSSSLFEDGMIKGVVDVRREILVVDAELHADIEEYLLNSGSLQEDLWGINLYPDDEEDFVEYDSLINIRPGQGNRSRGIEDERIRQKVDEVVAKWIK